MNLLFVNSAWPQSWGGGEKWTIEAAHFFRERGHEITIIARPNSLLLKAAGEKKLIAEELRFGGDFDPFTLSRVRRLLKTHKPHLIIVNFNKEAWQFGLGRVGLTIPLFARHGFPLFKNKYHHKLLAEQIIDRLVVNADSIKTEYQKLGFDTSKIQVIHNGVKTVPQKTGELRKRFSIEKDELIVVGSGRLESQKRFDRFIQIAESLSQNIPNIRFIIFGEGPDKPKLQALIHEKNLESKILLGGFAKDFAQIIGDADLFLLTSEKEGTPNVLLEAMAAAVPCVSFAVGSMPEIFFGPLAPNLIGEGDTDAMLRRAEMLLKDSELRKIVSQHSLEQAKTRLSFEVSMSKYEKIFLEMTGRDS